ncbi:hypothetical protein KCL46_002967 [Clostridium perfringens]|nr:hypothetical protein [Clostridium perfringens]
MELNVKLESMELIEESFKNNKNFLEDISETVKANMNNSFRVGTMTNLEENKEKIAVEYNFNIVQRDSENNKEISELNITYIATFDDVDNTIISKMNQNKLNDEELRLLISNLSKLAYPYIKDYMELKYNKANMKIKLPLELSV